MFSSRCNRFLEKSLLVFLLFIVSVQGCCQLTLSGKILDSESDEDVLFATVYVKGTQNGTTSNEYGFYSISLKPESIKKDSVTIVIGCVGYRSFQKTIEVKESVVKNFKILPSTTTLKDVVITASRSKQEENLRSTQMSMDRLKMKDVKALPAIAGEADIVKVAQLLPGISAGVAGTSSMFVRGGKADQNLVMLDEATLYEVGHLLGFFSVFNSDAIKDITTIKGGFPANYGGRLSALMDVRMQEGNDQKFEAIGGIGTLSSRLTLQGPIAKERASFLISGRRTYLDQITGWLFSQFDTPNPFPIYFYDLNGKCNFRLDDKNRFFFSSYFGRDIASGGGTFSQFDSEMGNFSNTLRWNHIYGDKLFSNVSLIYTSFHAKNFGKLNSATGTSIKTGSMIQDFTLKIDYDYFTSDKSRIKFGANAVTHDFKPSSVIASGEAEDLLNSSKGDPLVAQELALYGNLEHDLSAILKVNVGLRLSGSIARTKFYGGLEPRASAAYMLSEHDALKLSYSRMRQYVHRVSSATISLPTDLWYPVTDNVKPQTSDQVALGYNHLFDKIGTSISVEGYYKKMYNLIEYREGAMVILNNDFADELVQGNGSAYGVEFLTRKEKGNFTGWIGYTLSWSDRQFDALNEGKRFWARYDRRHSFSVVATLKLGKRVTLGGVWEYATGARFTPQVGMYFVPDPALDKVSEVPIFGARNSGQMKSSHRLDLSLTLDSKKKRKFYGEWVFSIYNVYDSNQPWRVGVEMSNTYDNSTNTIKKELQYMQRGVIGFLPAVTYNFKF